ncbi:hypothetical protein Godav_029708, partial [Gossypium davidsonii]|nr:hypothetical protein [Gossypium davidsonii]
KSVNINRKQQKVTVTGYVEANKVLKKAKSTGKKAEIWPYVPYNLVAQPYAVTAYDKKAPPGYVRKVDNNVSSTATVTRYEDPYITMFSDENPNACSSCKEQVLGGWGDDDNNLSMWVREVRFEVQVLGYTMKYLFFCLSRVSGRVGVKYCRRKFELVEGVEEKSVERFEEKIEELLKGRVVQNLDFGTLRNSARGIASAELVFRLLRLSECLEVFEKSVVQVLASIEFLVFPLNEFGRWSEVQVLGCVMGYLFCCLSHVSGKVGVKYCRRKFELVIEGVEEKSVERLEEKIEELLRGRVVPNWSLGC